MVSLGYQIMSGERYLYIYPLLKKSTKYVKIKEGRGRFTKQNQHKHKVGGYFNVPTTKMF